MRTGNRLVRGICALVLALALPAGAQAQATAATPAAVGPTAEASDTAVITIFGRPPARVPTNRLTTINLGKSASGCGFMGNSSGADLSDDYFDSMYGADQPDDGTTIDGASGDSGRRKINPRSPYGDASTPTAPAGDDTPEQRANAPFHLSSSAGGCTQAEINFASGRADIAAHDRSMQNAWAAYNAGDYPKALDLFKYSWNKMGYPITGLMVGKMYLLGVGQPRDTKQAIVWLKKVAELGYTPPPVPRAPVDYYRMRPQVDATMTLAKIYDIGWDVPVDHDEARHWYSHADEIDYYPATHIMGRIYLNGYGVPRDVKKAITYFKRAGQMGFAPSQYTLGEIYYDGDDGVPQNKTLAGAWLLLAAKRYHPDALYAVARMYELGEGGTKVDPAKALIYYKEAAVRGQPDAQNVIGTDFYLGTGLPKQLDVARKWFLAGAERGNPDAMFNLAVMLANGEGGPKDLVKAYCWFYIADKGGVEKAAAAMAELAAKMTPEERAQADALLNPKAKS